MTETKQVPVEPAAHMWPSDLKKFETCEGWAKAFSIAMMRSGEDTVPLYTLEQAKAMLAAAPATDHPAHTHCVKCGQSVWAWAFMEMP